MRHEEDETRRTWATRTKWFQESAPQATHKSRDQRDLRLWLYSRRRSIKIPHVTTDKHTKSPVDRGRGRKVETTPDKKCIKNPFLNYKDRRLGAVHLKITLDLHNSCSLSVVGLSCTAQCLYGQFHYLLRVVNLHLNMGTQLYWNCPRVASTKTLISSISPDPDCVPSPLRDQCRPPYRHPGCHSFPLDIFGLWRAF